MPRNTSEAHQFLERVTALSARMQELHAATPEQAQQLMQMLDEARRGGVAALPRPVLTVMLLGASGAGKSELLNAFAGERIATAGHLRPTTTRPALYLHRDVSPEFLSEASPVLAQLAADESVRHFHNRDELRDKVIIDAPDIDSYRTEHRQQVLELLPAVDVALYVVTPHNYKDDLGWQLVLKERGRRAFAFVLNKWDDDGKSRPASQGGDVDDDFTRMLVAAGYTDARLFRTSAKYWVDRRTGEVTDERPPRGDQLLELEEWLTRGLSRGRIAAIQARRRRGMWSALHAALVDAVPPPAIDPEWRKELDSTLDEIRQTGKQLLEPATSAEAHAIARQRNQEQAPRTPGVFGQMVRLGSVFPAMRRGLQAQLGDGGEVISRSQLAESLARVTRARLNAAEWSARRAKMPAEWLNEKWGQLAEELPDRTSDMLALVSAEAAARKTSRLRRFIGYLLLIVVDTATTAAVGLALWRVAWAFVQGAYLGGAFATNFLVLLICLILIGRIVVSLFFTTSANSIRRELTRRVAAGWETLVQPFADAGAEYLEKLEQIAKESREVAAEAESQIRAAAQGASRDDAVDALFQKQ